jgi:carbamoyl-phosphate synthase large subunit
MLCCCPAGKVFISMADKYKADAVGIAKQLTDMGYQVVATRGTASTLMSAGATTSAAGTSGRE